jgi:hypothetical protein
MEFSPCLLHAESRLQVAAANLEMMGLHVRRREENEDAILLS